MSTDPHTVEGGAAKPVYVVNQESSSGVQSALGNTTDIPSSDVQGAAARTAISLLKGIQNFLKSIVAGIPLTAGEAHIGQVGGDSVNIDCIPTLTVHATYATGDYVGESGVAFEVPNAARVNGGSGFIVSAMLIDYAKQSVAGEIWLFDAPVTPPNDSAAWTLSDADMAHCFAVIPLSTYYASALNSVAQNDGGRYMFKCTALTRKIWFCFVTRGAPAYASGDLTFRFFISQDI
jgi:hypothetical protein